MKKVNYHHSTSKVLSFCLVILLAFSTSIFAQNDAAKGKTLFNANCAACHKLDKRTIGPALAGVSDRRKRDWLHSWIKDSQALIASGDADAKAIFDEYKIPMTAFSQFSDNDIDNILAYLTPSKEATTTKEVAQGGGDAANGKKLFNANCAACHKLDKRTVGPALGNVGEKRKKEWLHSWIKNSQALIASGDADAKAIFDEYKIPMASFSQFSDAELDDIIAYTTPSLAKTPATSAAPATSTAASSTEMSAQAKKGKDLFNTNCAACHKLDKRATGPALRGVTERREKEWLHKWIKNSKSLIDSGDADAKAIFDEFKIPMTPFPQLSDEDIDAILAYTSTPKVEKAATAVVGSENKKEDDSNTNVILGIFVLVLALLLAVLFFVNKKLKAIADEKGIVLEEGVSLWKAFIQNQFLVLIAVVLFALFGAYHAFGFLMQVGVDEGYKPVQPIHFSHRIHAGDNGIDCKYCHSNARVSKTSGVPALNVCMNCHKSISEVAESTATAEHSKEFYDGEIQKLYDAVGWKDFKYTGKTKPVQWVRVHNLPDFAYYNHSQHVSVAGLKCQECHGEVEKMEILEQHAPLTMGWCINCHREKEVNMEGNAYYEKIHDQLKKKYGVDKFTVAQMGGMECGKCHY